MTNLKSGSRAQVAIVIYIPPCEVEIMGQLPNPYQIHLYHYKARTSEYINFHIPHSPFLLVNKYLKYVIKVPVTKSTPYCDKRNL